MEIFGVLILLCLFGAVSFYLKIDVLGKLSSVWDDITLAIGNKRAHYARKREAKEKIKNKAITAASKKAADKKDRAIQTWKKIRELSREQQRSTTQTPSVGHMDRLFKSETIRALFLGRTPPSAYGHGQYTIKSLKENWNDEWQVVADDLNIDLFLKPHRVGSPLTNIDPEREILNIKIESLKQQIAIQSELQTKLKVIERQVYGVRMGMSRR